MSKKNPLVYKLADLADSNITTVMTLKHMTLKHITLKHMTPETHDPQIQET